MYIFIYLYPTSSVCAPAGLCGPLHASAKPSHGVMIPTWIEMGQLAADMRPRSVVALRLICIDMI